DGVLTLLVKCVFTRVPMASDTFDVVRMHVTEELGHRVDPHERGDAHDPIPDLIAVHPTGAQVDIPDAQSSGFGCLGQTFLALAGGLLRAVAAGDVTRDAERSNDMTAAITV